MPSGADAEGASVIAANEAFYQAFESMDLARMAGCWAGDEGDMCVHPGWELMVDWRTIRETWRTIFANTGYARIHITEVELRMGGEVAWVTCVENLMMVADQLTSHSTVAATNIFRRVGADWKVVLHHGSPIAHSVQMETDELN